MRSTTLVLFSTTLIACGTDGKTHVGGPCQSDRTCDDGQICDQTDPGGPVCLDISGDIDNDGIQNGMDFCEHMAGGAFDEDSDGIGDECDACPIAKPSATADTDGDGVDGFCDPDTSKPGDKIVLFSGFNGPLPGTWKTTQAWKIQGGEAIMTPVQAASDEQLTIPIAVPSNHMTIQVGYRIDSVAPGAAEAAAGVVSFVELPLGVQSVKCVGARMGPLDQLVLETDATVVTQELMNLFNPASLYRLGEQLDGGIANCALITDKETGVKQGPAGGSLMNQVGLRARGATVRFAYVLVTQR